MNVPKDLVDQIARGKGAVFVGAGLSQGAGLPGWPGLLRQMLDWSEKHGKELSDREELEHYIDNGELLLVAEEMRERLGKDHFRRFMAEIFRKPGLKPTAAQMLLPQIPFAAALTSNYEVLLESAYTVARGAMPHVFTHEDYPELSAALRTGEFYVLKVHGTIDRIQTLVLGQSDYREVMHANLPYRQHLTTLFSSMTVLFLGFGLTDPDILLLLDELRVTFKDYTGKHYALMSIRNVPAIKQKRFEKDFGIEIIPYTPAQPDHPEVHIFLIDLMQQVKQVRDAISTPVPGPATPLEDLAAEVRTWLQAVRYELTEPQRRDDRTVEMLATLDQGTIKQRVLVRCIGGEIVAGDVDALDEVLDR
jgi:SIR2-like domain